MKIGKTEKAFIVGILIVLVGYGVHQYVANQHTQLRTSLQHEVDTQITTLQSLAALTNSNTPDARVSTYVRDCSADHRQQFDTLLAQMDQLSPAQLRDLDLLYSGCASYFSDKKAALVSQFEREVGILQMLIAHLGVIDRDAAETYELDVWRELLTLESQRADLLRERVTLQAAILTMIQDGVSTEAEDMKASIRRSQEINEYATVLARQIEDLTQAIVSL